MNCILVITCRRTKLKIIKSMYTVRMWSRLRTYIAPSVNAFHGRVCQAGCPGAGNRFSQASRCHGEILRILSLQGIEPCVRKPADFPLPFEPILYPLLLLLSYRSWRYAFPSGLSSAGAELSQSHATRRDLCRAVVAGFKIC